MSQEEKKSRSRLYGFILFSVIEEGIIGIIAFILLLVFLPSLLIPGIIVVGMGLVVFTLIKIYYYQSSTSIPVEDPMIGLEGTALIDFLKVAPNRWEGKILVRGEHWKAQADIPISQNAIVKVIRMKGLTLFVTKPVSE